MNKEDNVVYLAGNNQEMGKNRKILTIVIVGIFILIYLMVAFGRNISIAMTKMTNSQNPAKYSNTLYVFPGAQEVVYYHKGGTQHVTYYLKENYPPLVFLSAIDASLEKNGYKLSPAKDNKRGWSEYFDDTKGKEKEVKTLIKVWENDERSHSVFYCIEYVKPKSNNADDSKVIVDVAYVSFGKP